MGELGVWVGGLVWIQVSDWQDEMGKDGNEEVVPQLQCANTQQKD